MNRKILIGIIFIILGISGIFKSFLMFNDATEVSMAMSSDMPLGVLPPEITASWLLGFFSIIFLVVGIIFLIRGKLSKGKIIVVIVVIFIVLGGMIYWEFLNALEAINHYWAQNQEILSDKYCDTDDDCACGINKTTRSCFYGNKDYVDTMQQCPDFCTGIGGNFEIKCVNKECKQVSTIKESETADWKTYRNEEYGFEIKYPKEWNNYPDWEARKGWSFVSGQVSFSPFTELELEKGEGAGFVVSVLNSSDVFTSMGWINPSELAVRELIEKEREIFKDEYGEAKFKITDENLNGLPVVKEEINKLIMDDKEGSVVDYYINNGSRKFVIGYAGSVQGVNNNLATFNQMLSTFKFIETSSSDFKVIGTDKETGWDIGRSDNYGFEIKYPSNNSILTEGYIGPSVVAYLKMINESDQTEGDLSILVTSATSSDKCDGPSQIYEVEGFPITSSAFIGSVIFTRIDYYSDAIDLNRDYTTFRNGFCYNIHLVAYPYSCISSGCGDRRWSEVTFQAMLNNFNSIVNTFRFISQ